MRRAIRDADKRCRRLAQVRKMVAGLNLPVPASIGSLCLAASRRTMRPIKLVRWEHVVGPGPPPAAAMCLPTRDLDVIFYGSPSPAHELHAVAHEVGHLVFAHRPTVALADLDDGTLLTDEGFRTLYRQLLPDVDPGDAHLLGRGVHARASFTDEQELVAEDFADQVGRAAGHTPLVAPSGRSDPVSRVLDNLARALGPIQRRSR